MATLSIEIRKIEDAVLNRRGENFEVRYGWNGKTGPGERYATRTAAKKKADRMAATERKYGNNVVMA